MDNPAFTKHRDSHRWVVFAVICVVYFFVYFHRVSTSVIASDLLISFHTNATILGFMSSMYFYLYALEQPIIGYLTDRIGPRKVIGYWSITAAAGCFLFGMATNIHWASAGRAIIGLGVGGVYVPALMAITQWFRKKEFSTMVGFLMAAGNFGAVIATTPLAKVSETWGWRPAFFLIGGITLGMAFVTLLFTRDNQRPTEPVQLNLENVYLEKPDSRSKVRRVLTFRRFWILATIFFIIYGMLVTLQGLWATPFLMSGLGIERIFASKINMLIPVGVVIGAPLIGLIVDRFSMNMVIPAGSSGTADAGVNLRYSDIPDLIVRIRHVKGLQEFISHLGRERIQLVRPVQRYRCDSVFHGVPDVLELHRTPSLSV